MGYAWNKLYLGIQCLTRAGSQKERLAIALGEHLACIRPRDLPFVARAEFAAVLDRLCAGRALESGASVRQLVERLNDHEVNAMIDAILNIYDTVTRYQPIRS